jgi:DNA polymerase-1
MYKLIRTLTELKNYIADSKLVAFDFETAPTKQYRTETKAALDAHKSHIIGISFSVAESDGVYLPLAHRVGENAPAPEGIWDYLA